MTFTLYNDEYDKLYDNLYNKIDNMTKHFLIESNIDQQEANVLNNIHWTCYREHKLSEHNDNFNKEDNIMELEGFDFTHDFSINDNIYSVVDKCLKKRINRILTIYNSRLGSKFIFENITHPNVTNFILELNMPIDMNSYTFYSNKQMDQMMTEIKILIDCLKSVIMICAKSTRYVPYERLYSTLTKVLLVLKPWPSTPYNYLNTNWRISANNTIEDTNNNGSAIVKKLLNDRIFAESKFRLLEPLKFYLT